MPERKEDWIVESLGKNARGVERVRISVYCDAEVNVSLRDGIAPPCRVKSKSLSPAGILKVWEYGLGKYLRDGAGGKFSKKKADKGREFSEEELTYNAVKNAGDKLAGLYSGEILARVSGLTIEAREFRGLLSGMIAKLTDSSGKKLGQKGVPSAVAAGAHIDGMTAGAKAAGLKPVAIAKALKKAQAIAAIHADD